MNLHLTDKVYVVTGGSEGIGRAITLGLLEEAAQVMIATRSRKVTETFVQELSEQGFSVDFFIGDLAEVEVCKDAIQATLERFGRIDGLVNNAGRNDGVDLESGPAAFQHSLVINLSHYYNLVHFALAELKKNRGSIVNISSKVALTGQGKTSGYAASKGAQLALTREWATELAPHGVRVNAVLPAEVMTPLYREWLETSFDDPSLQKMKIGQRIPLSQRMTTPEEIAAMTVFLLSEKSDHTTGQWIVVDGGYVHLDRALTL